MRGVWKFDLAMLITLVAICYGWNRDVKGAGLEVVEITNVTNTFQHICQPANPSLSIRKSEISKQDTDQAVYRPSETGQPVPGCTTVLRYQVTFKRKNGMSGQIITIGRPTSKKLMIEFCPGFGGAPEKPCPQQGF